MTDLTPDERAEWRRTAAFGPSHGVNINSRILLDLLDAADERDKLAAQVERVRKQHRPVGIYDECDCPDEAKSVGHVDVYVIGLTCNKLYDICAECCRDDVYQTETCADYHEHKLGETHHCPTINTLDGTDETTMLSQVK